MNQRASAGGSDEHWIQRAIALARKAGNRARPNPPVGCILVRDGVVVGEGFHERAGQPHAEIEALRAAGSKAAGATAYVTLEPCNHQGRTGPCSEALIAAQVARVVYGCDDPNPVAVGGGARLMQAGVAVTSGVMASECATVAEVFLTNIGRQRPFFRLKLAATLDGYTAAADGSSRWITGPAARAKVHALRADADAVLVGSGTVLRDDPNLNVRHVPCDKQPTRVVLDRRLRTTRRHLITQTQHQPTIVCTTTSKQDAAEHLFAGSGVTVLAVGDGRDGWLQQVSAALLQRGLHAIFCEPGATLAAAMVRAGLVDRIDLVVGGKLLGSGRSVFEDLGIARIEDAKEVDIDHVERIDNDAWISARVRSGS